MANSPAELNDFCLNSGSSVPQGHAERREWSCHKEMVCQHFPKPEPENCATAVKNLKKAKKKMEFFAKMDYF